MSSARAKEREREIDGAREERGPPKNRKQLGVLSECCRAPG